MAHLRESNDYWRTPEYIDFSCTNEFTILKILLAAIVREGSQTIGGMRLYRKYFSEGKLVSRYSLDNLAIYMRWIVKNGKNKGKPDRSRVSKCIHKLEKNNFLKIHKDVNMYCKMNVYQLGTWEGVYNIKDGSNKYTETIWMDEIFKSHVKIGKDKRNEEKLHSFQSMGDMVNSLNKNHENYG